MLLIDGKEIVFYNPNRAADPLPGPDAVYGVAAPGRYLQGFGLIQRLPEIVCGYGVRCLILVTRSLYDEMSATLPPLFGTDVRCGIMCFHGLCCEDEVNAVRRRADQMQAEVIVGIGGGNLLDTVKLVACQLHLPLILMPSVASCDAATSAMSILNDEQGVFLGSVKLTQRASVIAVDTQLILRSPVRLFVSGMGDALATWFEARAGIPSGALNYVDDGYRPSYLGRVVAKTTYDTLAAFGRDALRAFRGGYVDEALNAVIENDILLSGLGFENTCCSIAHGLHGALEHFSTKKTYHGEKVAFGLLCQMCLEGSSTEEFETVFSFCRDVGLPLTLDAFGIAPERGRAAAIAEMTVNGSAHVKNETFPVTVSGLTDAILSADAIGRRDEK